MKYLITFILMVLVSMSIYVNAQTKTATSSSQVTSPTLIPTQTIEDKNIKNLKDKIATKVAELREKNNKAISGFVINSSETNIKIKNENEEEFDVKLDDALTKYFQISGTQTKEAKLSDIKKGVFIIISGLLNDKTITANSIYIDEMFLVKSGKVTEVDKDNFILKVTTTDKDIYSLETETSTKQQIINSKTLEIEKMGFSKIKEGDTVHFVVKKTGNEKDNKYQVIKFLIIPQEYFIK